MVRGARPPLSSSVALAVRCRPGCAAPEKGAAMPRVRPAGLRLFRPFGLGFGPAPARLVLQVLALDGDLDRGRGKGPACGVVSTPPWTGVGLPITNVTEEQLVEISKSSLVLDVGIQQRLGSVDTEQLRNARLGVVWINDTEWEHHRLPTISGVVGNYPLSKSEIMLPTWVLEQMGISDPQIGMEIVLSYQIGDSYDYVTDTFLLSGYYTDYIAVTLLSSDTFKLSLKADET